jgi:hypothetical protein
MKMTLKVLACWVAAVVTWFVAYWIAIQIPGSPFHRMFASDLMARLDNPATGPAAFEEFLALGGQMRWIEAIVFSAAAGSVVVVLSLVTFHLRRFEAAAVIALFSIFVILFHAGVRWPDAVSIFLFSAVVLVGTNRHPSKPQPDSTQPAVTARRSYTD